LLLIAICLVTGSCRPVLKSVVRRHVYETGKFGVRRELFSDTIRYDRRD